MTTETETLSALHLWLAERLEELRAPFGGTVWSTAPEWATAGSQSRGWVPNVTTDGLLEAMRVAHMGEVLFDLPGDDETEWTIFLNGNSLPTASATTPHEALCRAARKALDAA